MKQSRWPGSVYQVGDDPDPRFTLANERTFLAWLRTSLGLMAAGVGVEAVAPSGGVLRDGLALGLLITGTLSSAGAFLRWMAVERALRTAQPLPGPVLAPLLAYGLAVAGVTACILILAF